VVPAGTYTLKADSNAAISGTLGNGVTVIVGTTLVAKDVPINCAVVTGEFLLDPTTSINELDQDILNDFPLPTAGTGVSTGINEAPTLRSGQPAEVNVDPTAPTSVDLTGIFNDSNIVTSRVQIHTSGGDVNVDLLDDQAPQTVQNFYNYVNSGAYDNSIFHRLASGFVLQGGGFKYNQKINADATATPPITESPASITAIPTNPAVKNEFDGINRSNVAGTIAMAKLGGNPDSATNQFFFNLADNRSSINPLTGEDIGLDHQNGGFTVFGRLVGPDDTSVVNSLSTTTSTLKKFDASNATGVAPAVRGALDDLPLRNYANGVAKTNAEINATNPNDKTGSTFPTDTTAANFVRITGIDTIVRDEELTYTVISNSNEGLFKTPANLIKDNRLTLEFLNADVRGTATIRVRATDKHGLATGTDGNPDAIIVVTANAQPVFTAAAVNVPENTKTALSVIATDADEPTQTLTYSIVGGADQAKFEITADDKLAFKTAPDRENPTDDEQDNIYLVQVQVSDGNGGIAKQTISVTVTGVNDNDPVITSVNSKDVAENTTAVLTVAATDADLPAQTVTYSFPDLPADQGADQAKFNITNGGVLTFKTPPNFEIPTDTAADGFNTYLVVVQASDGNGGTSTQPITVTVTPVNDNNPVFTSPSTVNVDGSTTDVVTVVATDADLPAQTLSYSIVGGANLESFDITEGGVLTFKLLPDPGTYQVEILANDGNGGFNTQLITVNVGSM